ncbi:tripartite motif containing 13-like [Anneissia japonica]|uniref:tripartite motif containing 13-like n=1 Tax=Anneissia japonica TaxID=1529436 RepID=UPI0014258755|nr:tripartite motif containing 13-like [Anneissia japonica]
MDDTLSELLTCPSCSEMFDNTLDIKQPKVLPCQHVFCLGCLQGLNLEKRTLDSGLDLSLSETSPSPFDESLQALYCQCPSCSKKHRVPHDDVSNFDNSIVHDKLLESCKTKKLHTQEPRSETDELITFLKRAQSKLQKKIGSFDAKFKQKLVDLQSYCDANKEEVKAKMEELVEVIHKTEASLFKEIDKYHETEEKKLKDTHEAALERVKHAKELSENVNEALTGSQPKTAVHLTKVLGDTLSTCDDIEGLTENVPDPSLSSFECNIEDLKQSITSLGGETNVEMNPDEKEFSKGQEENDKQEEVLQCKAEELKEAVLVKDINDPLPAYPILSVNSKWAT